MNFVIENWYFFVAALVSGGLLVWPMVTGAAGGGLTASDAVTLINRHKGVVIDVREADEYAAGHVGGAKHVPLADLEKRLPEVVRKKDVPVILVCATGPRAQRAQGMAKKLGYEQAQALTGGLKAWKDANLPVEKG